MTKQQNLAQKRSSYWLRELKGYTEAFIFGFTTVGVAGSSMEPTLNGGSGRLPEALLTGDRLIVPKYETWLRRLGVMPGYQRGDIVIVREPDDSPLRGSRRNFVVKRVIGVPGNRLRIRDRQVFVNGAKLDQSFITTEGVALGADDMPELVLDGDEYFIMGDNRTNSADSRLYGPVSFMSIAGRASAIVLPPRREDTWNWRLLERPQAFAILE